MVILCQLRVKLINLNGYIPFIYGTLFEFPPFVKDVHLNQQAYKRSLFQIKVCR